jgi:hypothetical protein
MRYLAILFVLMFTNACDYQAPEMTIALKEGETLALNADEVLIFEKLVSDNRCNYANPCDSEAGEAKVRIVYQEKYRNRWHSKEHTLSTQTDKFLGATIRANFTSSYQRFTLKSVSQEDGKYLTVLKVEELPAEYNNDYYYDKR